MTEPLANVELVRARVGEPLHGLASLVAVGVRAGEGGELVVEHGSSIPDALRRLARRLEELEALGPLEREPRRAAIEAMGMALLALRGGCSLDHLDRTFSALERAYLRLRADVGLDVDFGLEGPEGERT